MKKKAKQQQAQQSISSMISSMFGGKSIEDLTNEAKAPSADEVADAVLAKLEERQKKEQLAADSGLDIDALAGLLAKKLGLQKKEGNNDE